MREPGRVCGCQRVGSLSDDPGRAQWPERAGREKITKMGVRCPFRDDVRVLRFIVGVEDLDQPGISKPARGTSGRYGRSGPAGP